MTNNKPAPSPKKTNWAAVGAIAASASALVAFMAYTAPHSPPTPTPQESPPYTTPPQEQTVTVTHTSQASPSCAVRYCGETHFDRSTSTVDNQCSDTQCQMSATFQNDGSVTGSATVIFTVTAIDYGPLIGSCWTVIPQTAPNGSTSAGCTAYFSSQPGTKWLNTTIGNP